MENRKSKGGNLFYICIFTALLGFFIILIQTVSHPGFVTSFDIYINNFFATHHTHFLTILFFILTLLGKGQMAVIVSSGALLFLYRQKKYMSIYGLLVSALGSGVCIFIIKHYVQRLRPTENLLSYIEPTFSFPSAHASISIAVYGYLTYVLLNYFPQTVQKTCIVSGAVLLALGIGMSRIYLGEHFVSDVFGGYIIGALWLLIGICISRAFPPRVTF